MLCWPEVAVYLVPADTSGTSSTMAAERTATDATLPLFLIHRVKFASIYALIIRQQNRAMKFLQETMLSPGSLVILPERLIS